MAIWDNWDLGLAGLCKVVGCPGMSRVVSWQLGTTWTWDWQGSGMSWNVPGCPMANWDNWNLGLAGWCKVVGGSQDVSGCPMATWDNCHLNTKYSYEYPMQSQWLKMY